MRPLVLYFALAYLFSWLIWLPLYGQVFSLEELPVLPFHHALGGLGPLLSAFITTAVVDGTAGVRGMAKRCFQVRPLLYLAIALLSPFVLAVFAATISYLAHKTPLEFSALLHNREFPQFGLLPFFIYNLVFFGYGEEVGWRGFALPRLQQKYSPLMASVVLTLFWALWHWPLFLYRPGYTAMDVWAVAGWFFSLLTGSVLLTWLFNASRGSLLICAVFHSTIDVAFTAAWNDERIVGYLGMLITFWGVATLWLINGRNKTSRAQGASVSNPEEVAGVVQHS
jgi:uncharacterized protein